MEKEKRHNLHVIIVSGPEAPGRAVVGFAFAVSGARLMVVLALDGITWAADNELSAEQPVHGFDSIANYINILDDSGAIVRLCSACVYENCVVGHAPHDLAKATPYMGLTDVAMRATHGQAQTVVF